MGCKSVFVGVAAMLLGGVSSAVALPFNQDLVSGQINVGHVMRPKAPNTVPLGSLDSYVPSREVALTWENPIKGDRMSTLNGKRLFEVNCSPCHGKYEDGKHTPGAVSNVVPGPDISLDMYKVKPDGHFFGYIHFGGMAIMPAYGWKLSTTEHWDIVNYVRHVQGVNPIR